MYASMYAIVRRLGSIVAELYALRGSVYAVTGNKEEALADYRWHLSWSRQTRL